MEDKKAYVEQFLAPAMVNTKTGIKRVEYRKNEKPYEDTTPPYATHYTEEVVVWYDDFYYKTVNVECDSLSGIFYDVARRIF